VKSMDKVTNLNSSIGEIPVVQHSVVKTRESLLLRKSNGDPEETTGSGKSSACLLFVLNCTSVWEH
jgi:hypothetical protein